MARMIPGDPPDVNRGGGRAEAAVFHALRNTLGPEFTVFHGRSFFDPRSADAGEIDFLVAHRTLGLLYIEVKGESVERRRDGKWYRGEEVIQCPLGQVIRHAHEFTRCLRDGWDRVGNGARLPLAFGYALAFPFTPRSAFNDGPDLSVEIVIASEDTGDIGSYVVNAMESWREHWDPGPPLGEADYRKFIDQVLNPRIRLDASLGGQLARESDALEYNTESQDVLFSLYLDQTRGPNLRLRVRGGAGTGKTRLCLEIARDHASAGRRVLLLCYNIHLATWLRRQVQSWGDRGGGGDVWHFHGLCEEALRTLGREPLALAGADKAAVDRYFRHELPYALWQAVGAGAVEKWDTVLVDEGQDFIELYWLVLEQCLRPGGSIVAFHDPQQDIFRATTAGPDGHHTLLEDYAALHPLTVNLRNSKRIVHWLREHLGCDIAQAHRQSPEGDVGPERRLQEGGARGRHQVEELVRELTGGQKRVSPEQICVLTLSSQVPSVLDGAATLAGFPLTGDPFDREGKILRTSARKFKGLESDVVIVVDVDPALRKELEANLRVACSRARHLLYVFEKA